MGTRKTAYSNTPTAFDDSKLTETLSSLVDHLVNGILIALRSSAFNEVVGEKSDSRRAVERTNHRASSKQSSPKEAINKVRIARTALTHEQTQVSQRIIQALADMGTPMGIRTLAQELDVEPPVIAPVLRNLVSDGKIIKHGDRRNTTYAI